MLQTSTTSFLLHDQMKNPRPNFLFLLSVLSFYCLSFLPRLALVCASDASASYIATNYTLHDIGSAGNSTANDHREWVGDEGSTFVPFPLAEKARAEDLASKIVGVPYSTARVSSSNFTFTYPLADGPIFIRLHFNPVSYSGFEGVKVLFSVKSGPYTLLANFRGYLTDAPTEAGTYATYAASREFCINVVGEAHQELTLTFASPPDSHAFVNGIEIVPMPPSLYYTEPNSVVNVDQINTFFTVEDSYALETVYRLNVGGPSIKATDDSDNLFRIWSRDDLYVTNSADPNKEVHGATIKYNNNTPSYVAPKQVYLTSRSMGVNRLLNERTNLTWTLPVDSGFEYLVRLHFCETNPVIVRGSQRQFDIYINRVMVEEGADVIQWADGNGVPVYRDYAVRIESEGSKDESNLSIELATRRQYSKFSDAILNAIEVFKLSNNDGTLAGKNPEPSTIPPIENRCIIHVV